jgi:hypothetical protein
MIIEKLKQVLYTFDKMKINLLVDQLEWEFTNTLSIKTAHNHDNSMSHFIYIHKIKKMKCSHYQV